MTRRKRRMLTLRNNNKKMENCEENCVELILFGDSGHFVLTSILHVIALWAKYRLNFKYAILSAKFEVKSLKYATTFNLTSQNTLSELYLT
jgi:hypothetical protein